MSSKSIARCLGGPIALCVRAAVVSLVVLSLLWFTPSVAAASDEIETTDAVFARASRALERGKTSEAIADLEALADRGVLHPDVSYNRGLAYAIRARTEGADPGDLGRAAAGFEEATRLRPGDADATLALERVRAEVTRRRARQDKSDTIVRPTLDRVVVGLAAPSVWAGLALAASCLFALGLLLRRRPTGPVHVAGTILAPLAGLALAALVPITLSARHLATSKRTGVVTAPELAIRDEAGNLTSAPAIPEAALVEVGSGRDQFILVRWGSYEGWVPRSAVRVLGIPSAQQ